MLNGDYYPLTPIHRTPEKWVARQFDCPESGKVRGFVQGIRLPACPRRRWSCIRRSLLPESTYVFENPETGEARELTGAGVVQRDGFTFALPPREGALWFYRTAANP